MSIRDRRYYLYNQWGQVRAIVCAPSESLALIQAEGLWKAEGEHLHAILDRHAPRTIRVQALLLN